MRLLINNTDHGFSDWVISELGKHFKAVASILAALPLTSVLAMIWLYADTKDLQKVTDLSYDIFWAVLSSLAFFLVLPYLLKTGMSFPLALLLSCLLMIGLYALYIFLLGKAGIKF